MLGRRAERNGIQFRTTKFHSFGDSAIRCSTASKLRNLSLTGLRSSVGGSGHDREAGTRACVQAPSEAVLVTPCTRAGLFGGGGPRTPGRSRVECPIGVDPNHTSGG